ncbi:endonuclease III [Candidatus Roizmanbacteria bacterium CG_4_10_14_0_8_um_filter_33_9]|uniref:Endonuclease III n=1 Tax=Candidatus Roizmanbacteria bacterium CG_4_10_14_0_8_um_filter_33_9 TaxID=1974826 RepID=A0A2M7QJH3_9BACT|nr:MAG: endonuclease III [Candidatus Roizmanbacteria bacterium CG_4_10_14_0_8_um_filter_33_9]
MNKQKRTVIILNTLKRLLPDAKIVLRYSNHWELLVAVILSAQCTDKQVNKVTARLFRKYRTLEDYINVDKKEFEKDIFSTGFYRNKTKHILESAKIIQNQFGGRVPQTMKEILTLPGVARKTANVVLGNAYGIVEGIAVDTHVIRLSRLWELTKETDPVKIEKDLMKLIPKKDWFIFTYHIIEYGRKYCIAKRHDHQHCPLTKLLEKK